MESSAVLEIAKNTMVSMMQNNPLHFWAVVFILFVALVCLIAGIAGFIYAGSNR